MMRPKAIDETVERPHLRQDLLFRSLVLRRLPILNVSGATRQDFIVQGSFKACPERREGSRSFAFTQGGH